MSFFRLSCFVFVFFLLFCLVVCCFVCHDSSKLTQVHTTWADKLSSGCIMRGKRCMQSSELIFLLRVWRDSMGYIHIPLFLWKLSFILWFIDSSNVPCLLCVLFQEALLSRLSSLFNFSSQAERLFRVHNVHVLLMWCFHNRVLIVRNVPIVHSSPIPWPLSPPSIYHPGQYRTPSGLSGPLT